ncbi:MAG TPA: cysteine-rich CWC family protein [Chitinophaga sp.]
MYEGVACPRCGAYFECKVGNVSRCQCQAVTLTEEDRAYIRTRYNTCLCARCLEALRNEHRRLPGWQKTQDTLYPPQS